MPKYLWNARYTTQGMNELRSQGGVSREKEIRKFITSAGGKLESCYFGIENNDVFLVIEMPDHTAIAALAMAAVGSGNVDSHLVTLLTPKEIDAAARKSLGLTVPGKRKAK